MTDQHLADFMGLSPSEAAVIIPNLRPEQRATYERMAEVEASLARGVVPPGVIACR